MGNILIEGAIDGLRLIGIDVPPSAESFIEMLFNEGVDIVSEVPKIISFIEQLGSEAWSTIEQIATGMEKYGPVGYIEHLIDQAYDPHYQTVKEISQQKKVMLDTHRTTLTTFQTQVQTLSTNAQPFSGQAATSSGAKMTTLTTGMSSHLDLLDTSLSYDQQFYTKYGKAKANATDAAIITLIIIGVALLIFIASVILTGGATLALATGGAVAAGGLTAGMGWALIGLAALDAVFIEWAMLHEGLVKPITLDWNPFVVTAPDDTTTTTTTTAPTPVPIPVPTPKPTPPPVPKWWPWPFDPFPPDLPGRPPDERDDCLRKITAVKAVFPDVRADLIHYLVCLNPAMTPQQVIDLFTLWTAHGMTQQDINNLLDRLRNLRLPPNWNQPSRNKIISFLRTYANDIPDIWQKYQQIQNIPNADFILRDMISGPDSKYRGSYFQLNWVVANQNSVAQIEFFGNDGRQGADVLLNNGTLVDTKNYIWADQGFLLGINQPQQEITDQLNRYMTDPNFAGRPVRYVFNSDGGKVPASIAQVFANARAAGLNVTVEYWPNPNPPQIVP